MRSWKERNSLPSAINQIVVPKVLRNEIWRLGHQSALSTHLGIHKTFDRISNHFFWPGIHVAIKTFVRSCNICQKLGKSRIPEPAPLINLPILNEPFERLGIDIIDPLSECRESGNRFVLSVIDLLYSLSNLHTIKVAYCSQYCQCFPKCFLSVWVL